MQSDAIWQAWTARSPLKGQSTRLKPAPCPESAHNVGRTSHGPMLSIERPYMYPQRALSPWGCFKIYPRGLGLGPAATWHFVYIMCAFVYMLKQLPQDRARWGYM